MIEFIKTMYIHTRNYTTLRQIIKLPQHAESFT